MLAIATTVLASLGRERRAFLVTLGALGGVLSACALLTPRAAFGEMQLLSTAVATSVGLGLALAVGATEVRREVGGFIPALTAVRALLALSVAGAAGTLFPATGRLVTPLVAVAIAAVYLLVLVVSRELTRDDLHALSSLRGG